MKNESQENIDRRQAYYIDGNTVRRSEAVPDYRREQRERLRREKEEERRRKQRIARRNQERELRMSRRYVVFLTMAVMVFGGFAGFYIHIQSDVTARMKTIASLESQIEDVKADNDEAYKRINTTVDLENIRNTAINELGMSYAKSSQIIYYTVTEDDYMNQYSEIPTK
jgi:cell division protein FtsL